MTDVISSEVSDSGAGGAAHVILLLKRFYDMQADGKLDPDWLDADGHTADIVFLYDVARLLTGWFDCFIKEMEEAIAWRKEEGYYVSSWQIERVEHAIERVPKYKRYRVDLLNALETRNLNYMIIGIDNIASAMHIDRPLYEQLLCWAENDPNECREATWEGLVKIVDWLIERTEREGRYDWASD